MFYNAFKAVQFRIMKKLFRSKHRKIPIMLLSVVTIAAVSVLVIFLALGTYKSSAAVAAEDNSDTVASEYIKHMESLSVADIEEDIYASEHVVFTEEELADPARLFGLFIETNTVVSGDSRMLGFNWYDYLDENHSFCGVGWSILDLPSCYDTIAALAPKNIVLEFGINEIPPRPGTNPHFATAELFLEEVSSTITTLRELVPGIHIYINSIMDCTDAFYAENPGYLVIPEWNNAIEEYCYRNDIGFIDLRNLCSEHQELYSSDGMHFQSEFYPLWGAEIMRGISEYEREHFKH